MCQTSDNSKRDPEWGGNGNHRSPSKFNIVENSQEDFDSKCLVKASVKKRCTKLSTVGNKNSPQSLI